MFVSRSRLAMSSVFAVVLALGCDGGSSLGTTETALVGISVCDMSGFGLVGFHTFDFDTTTGTVTYLGDLDSAAPKELRATSGAGACRRQTAGDAAVISGTAEWNGVAGYQYVFHALHIPAASATPTSGLVLDSVTLSVTDSAGALVFSNGGFVGTPHTSTVPLPVSGRPCSVDGSLRLTGRFGSGDTVSVTASGDRGVPTTGTVEVLGPPGGGRRFRFQGEVHTISCRQDGVDIADIQGYGTVNGESGFSFIGLFEDHDARTPPSPDFALVEILDERTGLVVHRAEGEAGRGTVSVSLR